MKLHLPITLYIVCFFAAPNAKAWDYGDVSFNIIGTTSLLTPIAAMVPRSMSLYYYYHDLKPTCQQLAHLNQSSFNHSGHNETLIHPLVEHCIDSSKHTSTSQSLENTLIIPSAITAVTVIFSLITTLISCYNNDLLGFRLAASISA